MHNSTRRDTSNGLTRDEFAVFGCHRPAIACLNVRSSLFAVLGEFELLLEACKRLPEPKSYESQMN